MPFCAPRTTPCQVGAEGLKKLNKTRKEYRIEIHQLLKQGKVYTLDPDKKFEPKAQVAPSQGATLVEEYGLR